MRSEDDGIRGKDYVIVQAGTIKVEANGDGVKSGNETDATRGYVRIEGGVLEVTAGGDGIDAQTGVAILGGNPTLSTGGGSSGRIDASASAKGIKGVASVTVDGGTFTIDSADDAVHSNGSIVVNSGTFLISSGDDGMHADSSLEINGGDIQITESYEGLEAAKITLNDGIIRLAASDDGVNVASGQDASGFVPGPGRRGQQGGMPGGGFGQDTFTEGETFLHINGGYLAINAYGDGVDANGPVEMTDGVVVISGPTERMNGALDYLGWFDVSGGFLVAAGSAGMSEAPSESSDQPSVLLSFGGAVKAGTLVHVAASDGEQVLTFAPAKEYETVVLSSPELSQGTTHTVIVGGSSTGQEADGLYEGGIYSPGTEYTRFTVSGQVTWVGGRYW